MGVIATRSRTARRGEHRVARRFLSYGVVVDPNESIHDSFAVLAPRPDDCAYCRRVLPGSSDGTAEACLWLDNP